jgi:hypothetical protein
MEGCKLMVVEEFQKVASLGYAPCKSPSRLRRSSNEAR